ncbi:MAG: hypothetical protein ACRESZ_05705 [Methylococcales bacterium]
MPIERHILRNHVVLHALENGLDIPSGTQGAELLDTRYYDEDIEENSGGIPDDEDEIGESGPPGASKRIPNRVARALKSAAQGLHRSQCGLGADYRKMAARLGKGDVTVAARAAD